MVGNADGYYYKRPSRSFLTFLYTCMLKYVRLYVCGVQRAQEGQETRCVSLYLFNFFLLLLNKKASQLLVAADCEQ